MYIIQRMFLFIILFYLFFICCREFSFNGSKQLMFRIDAAQKNNGEQLPPSGEK